MINFFTNNSEYIVILFSSVLTFFVGKITSSSAYTNQLLKEQLCKIYKPLSIKIHYSPTAFQTINEAKNFIDYFHQIITENYEYIPDKLLAFENTMNNCVESNDIVSLNKTYKDFSKYILIKFDVIRSKLNLPTNSLRNRWILMSKEDKMDFIFFKILAPVMVGTIIAGSMTYVIVILVTIFNKNIVVTEEAINKTFFYCIPFGVLIILVITLVTKQHSN